MATISTTNGGQRFVAIRHNKRDSEIVSKEEHIQENGIHETWEDHNIKELYNDLFQASVEEYNKGQERPERRIKDYFQKVKKDGQKNYAYEMIVGVYKKDGENISEATQKEILKEFYNHFKEKYGSNMKIVGAYYHFDECGNDPHLHLDYIPVGYNMKKGMKIQNSLTQALAQMGYYTEKFSQTAQMKFERECNDYLETLCNRKGIIIEHPMREEKELTGKSIRHQATHIYIHNKLKQELDRADKIREESYKVFTELKANEKELENLQQRIENINSEELQEFERQKVELTQKNIELKTEQLKLQEQLKKDKERIAKQKEKFERKELSFPAPQEKKKAPLQNDNEVRLDRNDYNNMIQRINQFMIDYQKMFDKEKEEIQEEKEKIEFIKGWENKEKYNQKVEDLYNRTVPPLQNEIIKLNNTITQYKKVNEELNGNVETHKAKITEELSKKYKGYMDAFQKISDKMDKLDDILQNKFDVSIDDLLKKTIFKERQ